MKTNEVNSSLNWFVGGSIAPYMVIGLATGAYALIYEKTSEFVYFSVLAVLLVAGGAVLGYFTPVKRIAAVSLGVLWFVASMCFAADRTANAYLVVIALGVAFPEIFIIGWRYTAEKRRAK